MRLVAYSLLTTISALGAVLCSLPICEVCMTVTESALPASVRKEGPMEARHETDARATEVVSDESRDSGPNDIRMLRTAIVRTKLRRHLAYHSKVVFGNGPNRAEQR